MGLAERIPKWHFGGIRARSGRVRMLMAKTQYEMEKYLDLI